MESGGSINVGNVNVVGDLDVIDGVVDNGVGINGVFNGVVNNVVNDVGNPETPPYENVGMFDQTPPIRDANTPDLSLNSSNSDSGSSRSVHGSNINGNDSDASQNDISANDILKNIRMTNINRLIIGTLDINFIAPKFDQLKDVIGNHLDIFTLQETKIDKSFPEDQSKIEGYHEPYRLDRNKHGGGVLIYVREDIPTKPLDKHKFTKNIESIFIEINLRKTKVLYFGVYRSENKDLGVSDVEFYEQVGLALDKYSSYDKFLLAGDFNMEEDGEALHNFLYERNAKNLVKEKTCFRSMSNQSINQSMFYLFSES